jgi:hypothetical protein
MLYYDRAFGFYCMHCGRRFNTEEVVILVEKAVPTSKLTYNADKYSKIPIVETNEVAHTKAKKREHLLDDVP